MGDHLLTWRFVRSSRTGTSHTANDLPCQDSNLARVIRDRDGQEVLVLVVSDGAGSASHSDVGSRLICDTILAQVQRFLDGGQDLAATNWVDVEAWLTAVVVAVGLHAEGHGLTPRDLAGTCLGCVIGPTATVCFQVGDGAIVVDDESAQFVPVFWPQRGEYANMTVFLSEKEAIQTAEWTVLPRQVERVAVLSDGIQMVALHYATRTAHTLFFAGLFATLEQQPPGESEALNQALDNLLDRKYITDRTDDDRTLILASRRSP